MSDGTNPHALLAALAELEAIRNPKRAAGRRQSQRFVVRGDAQLYPLDETRLDKQPVSIQLRDVGRGGIGFVSPMPIEANSTWRICFLLRSYVIGQQPTIVRHCQTVHGSTCLVGGCFCADTGLMVLLGVDPATLHDGDRPTGAAEPTFLAPGEVA